MRSAARAAFTVGALVAVAFARQAVAAGTLAVVAACANPNLPPELLAGAVTPPAEPLPVVTVTAPGHKLRLAVAGDEPDRELGLICVLKLKPQHGMIFVFERTADQEFWMKNTLIPLDMLWVDAGGTIANVAQNVPASTRTTPDDAVARRSGHGRFVIELAAGEAEADGLEPGIRLGLPPLRAAP